MLKNAKQILFRVALFFSNFNFYLGVKFVKVKVKTVIHRSQKHCYNLLKLKLKLCDYVFWKIYFNINRQSVVKVNVFYVRSGNKKT